MNARDMSANAIELKNLAKHFDGVKAVDNLSLVIKKGTITSLIGPNGSGKTTLINLLSGILPFDQGIVVISGQLETRLRPYDVAALGLTRTFQEIRLFEQMSVLDNILVVLTERNIWSSLFEKHQARHLQKAEEVLSKVGLWPKRTHLASSLSYGQRRLLEIARVLAMNSEIILLDEPFVGLFPEVVKLVSGIIMEMKQQGKTIILIEHNMNLIRQLSDYVLVMDNGRLLAEGQPDKVLKNPAVIEAYLGE
ncbi:ABC transporter ATP-binding protein [Candidatus Uhrbacteria bacterium]|nr:ABC transporter ATP-binding protein [Candidatus Uhrbacteria bacterium]